MPPINLRTLKRSELQKLAKEHGVKANIKNDGIISALESIFSVEKENKKTPNTSFSAPTETPVDEFPTPPIDSSNDLMSIKPPWNNSDLMGFDSTPEQDGVNDESMGKESETEGRTRGSSGNTTPQMKNNFGKTAAKTFSIEKVKTKPRRGRPRKRSSAEKNTAKAAKRRSTNANEIIQTKKLRRSSSTTKQESDDEKNDTIDENMQKEIMEEIRKKIEATGEKKTRKSSEIDSFASRIPRFTASGVIIGTSKAVTPGNKDWNKLHNKKFEKLESIDDYERRKRERAERLLGSNKKNNITLSRLAQPMKRSGPKVLKPVVRKGRPKPAFMSPAVERGIRPALKTPRSIMKDSKTENKTGSQLKTPKRNNTSIFKPTVTSTNKMNLNFAEKSAKVATPKRVTIVSDQGDKKQIYVKTPAAVSRTKSVITPGEKRKSLIGTPANVLSTSINNLNTPSIKKNPFDLKQSLKKPLTWVPHKGPLLPFDDTTKKPSFQDRMKDIKKPNIGTRDKRKRKAIADKKQVKDKRMMMRRGIK